HVKGAFTGAIRDKPGLLEAANGGTMFLDELIEMPKPIQAKLLRVIQDGVVRRVGSESTDAIVNVRFIAATNRHPEDAVRSGTLRGCSSPARTWSPRTFPSSATTAGTPISRRSPRTRAWKRATMRPGIGCWPSSTSAI